MTDEFWHTLEAKEVFAKLNTSSEGLKSDEAARRLQLYGLNEIAAARKPSALHILFDQFKSLLTIILIIAGAISVLTGNEVDAVIIFVIVVISAILGFTQEFRAEKALEALTKMLIPTALVIRDGKVASISTKRIVPGDILVLKEGEKVAADARLIEENSLHLNEASLTGESVPVDKYTETVAPNAIILERKNMVFTGTDVTYGNGKAVVVAVGMQTELGKIAKEVTSFDKKQTPLEKRTNELGKWLGAAALIVSISVATIGILRGLPLLEMFLFGVALAVAAVPEALPAIVTGSLAVGMYRMAKKNALVRKMPAVETLGSTTVICSDKTGTLTRGEMTVRNIYIAGEAIDVSGVGYVPEGEFKSELGALQNGTQSYCFSMLMRGAILCSDAEVVKDEGKWNVKGDPTEGALVVAAMKSGLSVNNLRIDYPRISELPFSSERKRMTTVHTLPKDEEAKLVFMKGAPEIVLQRCAHVCNNNEAESLSDQRRRQILAANEGMANSGLRVLGIAFKELQTEAFRKEEELLENGLIFLGLFGMMDPPRKEVLEAVKTCQQIKIKPIMITGDHKLTAVAVARELGIFREGDKVFTGEDLEKKSQQEFEDQVENVSVYARVSPFHKLRIVEAWKNKGQVVAMTGDGVNDAPALKKADIGIAMGITGTEVTKESADLVLSDDNFATIVNAVETGRWIYDNIKKYLTYLLQANLVEIAVLSFAVLAGLPLPLLPVQILYINLATDGLPAIALGLSPADPDLMRRPPRSPRESIFTKNVKIFLLQSILILTPLLLLIFVNSLPLGVEVAQTRLFLIFIFFELTLALSCRSLKYNFLEAKPHKLLILSVLWETILATIIVSVPVLREGFGLVSVGIYEVLLVGGICLLVFFTMDGIKRVVHKD